MDVRHVLCGVSSPEPIIIRGAVSTHFLSLFSE